MSDEKKVLGFRVVSFGFCVSGGKFWVLCFEFRVVSFGFWVLSWARGLKTQNPKLKTPFPGSGPQKYLNLLFHP